MDGKVGDVRIDWFTATRKTTDGDGGWSDLGAKILAQSTKAGDDIKHSQWQGYQGGATSMAFAGYRTDGAILRLSGRVARDWWLEVAKLASNVTRIDLAVSYQATDVNADVALQGWNQVSIRGQTRGNQTEYTHIRSTGGGSTLYCGRRISEQFGRLYNKHAETKGAWPKGTWRYEVEYKGQTALTVTRNLVGGMGDTGLVEGTVHDRFKRWEVEPAWDRKGTPVRDIVSREPTTDETRMRWLGNQVRSTVKKVSARHHLEEIQRVLGLVEADQGTSQ